MIVSTDIYKTFNKKCLIYIISAKEGCSISQVYLIANLKNAMIKKDK